MKCVKHRAVGRLGAAKFSYCVYTRRQGNGPIPSGRSFGQSLRSAQQCGRVERTRATGNGTPQSVCHTR
jgi:hypothetical protein